MRLLKKCSNPCTCGIDHRVENFGNYCRIWARYCLPVLVHGMSSFSDCMLNRSLSAATKLEQSSCRNQPPKRGIWREAHFPFCFTRWFAGDGVALVGLGVGGHENSGRDWGIYGPKYAIGSLKTLQYQQETLWNCQIHDRPPKCSRPLHEKDVVGGQAAVGQGGEDQTGSSFCRDTPNRWHCGVAMDPSRSNGPTKSGFRCDSMKNWIGVTQNIEFWMNEIYLETWNHDGILLKSPFMVRLSGVRARLVPKIESSWDAKL